MATQKAFERLRCEICDCALDEHEDVRWCDWCLNGVPKSLQVVYDAQHRRLALAKLTQLSQDAGMYEVNFDSCEGEYDYE